MGCSTCHVWPHSSDVFLSFHHVPDGFPDVFRIFHHCPRLSHMFPPMFPYCSSIFSGDFSTILTFLSCLEQFPRYFPYVSTMFYHKFYHISPWFPHFFQCLPCFHHQFTMFSTTSHGFLAPWPWPSRWPPGSRAPWRRCFSHGAGWPRPRGPGRSPPGSIGWDRTHTYLYIYTWGLWMGLLMGGLMGIYIYTYVCICVSICMYMCMCFGLIYLSWYVCFRRSCITATKRRSSHRASPPGCGHPADMPQRPRHPCRVPTVAGSHSKNPRHPWYIGLIW